MARRLIVEIVGDADKLERELKKSQRSVDRFGSKMSNSLKAGGIAAGAALGAGIVVGLKNSVDAAMEAQAVLGQTQQALKNVGASWGRYGGQIQTTTTSLSRLAAVNDEELLQSFTLLLRGTKDVNRALALNAAAADLARGRNMDLTSAAQLLVKVNAGQLGSARRLGIQIDANATSQQALAEITRRYAGAAEAYGRSAAGAQDRFKIALGELQETLGKELLPTVTRYLTKGSKWLENTENTEKVTRTLEVTIGVTAKALDVLAVSAVFAADAIGKVGAAWDKLPDFGKDKGLFELLNVPGPGKGLLEMLGVGGGGGLVGNVGGGGNFDQLGNAIRKQSAAGIAPGRGTAGQSARELAQLAEKAAGQANSWFDARIARMLGRAGDPVSLREQIGNLRVISGLISQRLAVTKDITRKRKLEDQIADIGVQIRGREQQITDTAKAAAADRKREELERKRAETRKKWAARKAAAARAQAAIDRKFGWLDFGIERAEATKGSGDNRRALRKKEAAIKDLIRSEGRTLALVTELWRTRDKIRELNKKKGDRDPLAGLHQVSSKQLAYLLAAGTGLGVAGRRTLTQNISGAEIQPMYVGVNIDGREVGRAVARDNSRTSRRTARQTSGFRG